MCPFFTLLAYLLAVTVSTQQLWLSCSVKVNHPSIHFHLLVVHAVVISQQEVKVI